jgi:hypothetical protein
MLNAKFNITLGLIIILLSLLCLLINRLTTVNFEEYLDISQEQNIILKSRLLKDFIFSKMDKNDTCSGIQFSTIADLTYCFKTVFSDITYYSYLKEETIENECDMFDSLMNRVYIGNCLNSIYYDIQNSKSKISINNIYFPVVFNNDTFDSLNDDMFNVTIFDDDIFYTQVPEITYKVLPGINKQCVIDKVITGNSFKKLHDNLDNYLTNRRYTTYIPVAVLVLSILYIIDILLLNNCQQILTKSNLLIIIGQLILEYFCFLLFASIYFKSYKIMNFATNTVEGKCFDDRLTEYMAKLSVDSRMIHSCSLVIIIILFSKIVILLYILKILIMLNLVYKRTQSQGTTPRYKSANFDLSLELINKKSGMISNIE